MAANCGMLVWARLGRKGVHGEAAMKQVMDAIEDLYKAGGDYDAMVALLKELGKDAPIK